MSSHGSPAPSMDSNANGSAAQSAALDDQNSHGELVDGKLRKRTAASLDMEISKSKKAIPGEDGEEWEPVDYHGNMIRPLAYFGNFEVKYETKELPWISDNTSGTVHPDMPTISMLFNEDLTLPDEAEKFISQSAVLQEEARWERLKAAFYSFYPQNLRNQVFEVLGKMLPRDASRVIAKKTLRFENEIILIPRPKPSEPCADSDSDSEAETEAKAETDLHADEDCSTEDVAKLNKELLDIAREYNETLVSGLETMKTARETLAKYGTYKQAETSLLESHPDVFGKWMQPSHHDRIFCGSHRNISSSYHSDVIAGSKTWADELKALQDSTKQCMEARVLLHHLDHAVARYEPRTGWIHVKTQLLRRDLEENKTLPKEIFGIKLFPEYKIRGTPEAQNAAIKRQMEHFEVGLRDLAKGHLLEFDSYHNDPAFHLYHVRIPYEKVSPNYCGKVLESHLSQTNRYCIVSRPQILGYATLHHEMKVYIQIEKKSLPYKLVATFESTLEYVDSFGCCLNCFSKAHLRWECNLPQFGFACVTKIKEES